MSKFFGLICLIAFVKANYITTQHDLALTFNETKCGFQSIKPHMNRLFRRRKGRIIHGQSAVPNSWPWVVSVQFVRNKHNFTHLCGGVLINEDYVLTAAHCVHFLQTNQIAVITEMHDLDDSPNESNIHLVRKVLIHPDYDKKLKNDIALLKLVKKVQFTAKTSPICLPSHEEMIQKFTGVVIGWGGTKETSKRSSSLQQTFLKINNNYKFCTTVKQFDNTTNYCAYDEVTKGRSNICFGDSGGPLMHLENNQWTLYGISSFGVANEGKCLPYYPSYFVRIPFYLDWINESLVLGNSARLVSFNWPILLIILFYSLMIFF
jgi:secreted trypsin-like serine protease